MLTDFCNLIDLALAPSGVPFWSAVWVLLFIDFFVFMLPCAIHRAMVEMEDGNGK